MSEDSTCLFGLESQPGGGGGSCSYTIALHTTGEGELLPLSPLSEREDVCNVKKVNLALLLVLIIIITIIISSNAWRT